MQKTSRWLVILSVVAACQASYEGGIELPEGYVRATLPVMESGITYADVEVPERLPWGPTGIFTVKDGYAIPDNVRGRIVIMDDDFTIKGEFDVRSAAQGILAVASDGNDLVALDAYAPTPRLLRIDPNGNIKSAEVQLDHSTAPTGLVRDDVGLLLEFDGGAFLYRVEDHDGALDLNLADGYVWNGVVYSVDKPKKPYSHERIVRVGGHASVVRVPNHLGSVQIVGPDGDGGVYVLVEDVTHAGTISVEQILWHFSSTGEAVSVARIPLQERLVYTPHGLALDKNREPVAIVPMLHEVQFWNLAKTDPSAITSRKPSQLPDAIENGPSGWSTVSQGLSTYNGTCLSSSQIQGNVNEYLSVSVTMTSDNIDNPAPCSPVGTSRQSPSYLSAGPRMYSSVSYDWGGVDTPNQFVAGIQAGGKAGNLSMSPIEGLGCSYGVDCSGFVTRVWGRTAKLGTWHLVDSAYTAGPVYGPAYLKGEAFVKPGNHVVLFVSHGGNGFNLWESAGEPYGMVVSRNSAWSYVSGYQSRHSNTHCQY